MAISVGLNSAMRALFAQQQAMDAVAHNVANVNTPGYSRQRVVLTQAGPASASGVGGGVDFRGVERLRDRFVDLQARTESGTAHDYQARATSLGAVEATLGVSGPGSLQDAMDQFFNAWRDLANAPEQSATRAGVVQAGQTLALATGRVARSLSTLRLEADNRIANAVAEVNSIVGRLASLNGRILETRASGSPASDLTDERDLLLDRLAQLVDVHTIENDAGNVDVFVGGRSIVTGINADQIDLVRDPADSNLYDLQWRQDGGTALVRSGEIGGLLYQRDVDLPGRAASLDALVGQIVSDVNAAHAAGYALDGTTTGTAFFSGTNAATLNVDAAILADADLVAAASASGSVGDGRNALAIAGLQQALSMNGGTEDYSAYLNGVVTSVGVATRDAEWLVESQQMRLQHLESIQQATSGVNLDEEMVSMVQYQRGYEAAARMIRAIDDMLDHLLRLA
ncbi:MAG: flagellar hook-associated protein FlgK [Dehalococcoidia bacterium]|nr:MAG: flagellar hook-associated protein FlgK [Dehalococcoidia bacterium]